MRALRTAAAAALVTLVTACGTTPAEVVEAPAGWESFGAGLTTTEFAELDEILAAPESYDGQTVAIEAVTDEVCTKKGCWMTLSSDVLGEETVRVTFKDYGFFVPLDSAGKTARLQGTFEVKETSVADRKHYLEDAGKHDEAALVTEPSIEYTFVADGVHLGDA